MLETLDKLPPNLKKWIIFMYIITGRAEDEDIFTLFNELTGISKTRAKSLHIKAKELGLIQDIGQA